MKKHVIIASLLILVMGAIGNYLRYAESSPDRPADMGLIPMQSNDYTSEEHRFDQQSYDVLLADTTTLREYRDSEGNPIWLFVAYFESQKYGSQIHSPKHCLPGSGWKIGKIEPYRIALPDGQTFDVNRMVITERDHKQLMLYWFETRGGVIRSEFGLKWDLMLNSLFLRPTDAAFVRLNLPMVNGNDLEATTREATAYLAEFYPAIEKALGFAN